MFRWREMGNLVIFSLYHKSRTELAMQWRLGRTIAGFLTSFQGGQNQLTLPFLSPVGVFLIPPRK